jgi:hypothetical protein
VRFTIILLTLALLCGCAGSSPSEGDVESITRIGGSDKKVNTSVHASVSSGSGLSIGPGFPLSYLSGGKSEIHPLRYQVELVDDEQITVYHESDRFEVDDCVEMTSLVGDDKTPPLMKRIQGGCRADIYRSLTSRSAS